MKKQLKETVVYQPNDDVKITVVNKPAVDKETGEILTEQTVTIKVNNGVHEDSLAFKSTDDIAEFIGNINLEDPQQELELGV